MKSKIRFLQAVTFILCMTTFYISFGQVPEEGESIRHSVHLKTFYSEVDYRIAKDFIQNYKNQVAESSSPSLQAFNMHSSLSAAIENAQFKDQYKVDESFNGVRIYYGLKAGEKVAVVMPIGSSGRVAAPEGHEKVFVVTMPTQFHDPCPPLCD